MLGRILRSADFARVLNMPSCARSQHFAVHHLAEAPATRPPRPMHAELSTASTQSRTQPVDGVAGNDPLRWFGAVVPKRHARRSVTRSLLKRQMRAAAQRQAGAADLALAAGLWVVRLRAPFDAAAFKSAASLGLRNAARVELQSVLDQAARRVAGAPKAG